MFDFVGAGGFDVGAYDIAKYGSLDGHADDVIALATALDMRGGVFVGRSVSAMIGLIAAWRMPDPFSSLNLLTASPCYFDDGDHVGGFQREQPDDLLEFLDSNHLTDSRSTLVALVATGHCPHSSAPEETISAIKAFL